MSTSRHSNASSSGDSGRASIHSNILREYSKGNVFQKYEVTEVIGEGSIGSVCKVRIRPKKVGGSAFNPKPVRQGLLAGLFRKKTTPPTADPPPQLAASDHSQDHHYALKSIQLQRVTPRFLEELQNEIDILRSLDHPNIVRAHEVFLESKQIYLVMELCAGGDLYMRSPYTEKQAAHYTGTLRNTHGPGSLFHALCCLHSSVLCV